MSSNAGSLGFGPERKQSVGNWQEIPGERGKDRNRATFPMHRRYDAGQLDYSLEAEDMVVTALNKARARLDVEGRITVADTEVSLAVLRARALRQEELREEWHAGEYEDRYAASPDTKAVAVQHVSHSLHYNRCSAAVANSRALDRSTATLAAV